MKKYLLMLFAALAVGFQSCNNNDDLWSAIDDLKGRVQALEKQVDALNGNIEALQKLYQGATISSITETDGTYTIKLSNGETITLAQGSAAQAVIPIMSIDKDGYWQVSYDGGKSFEKLPVKASATDGVTPMFRIDEATSYWQVSYDGGKTYENVKDTKGLPVKAIGTGTVTDKFFKDVKIEGDVLLITMIGSTDPLRVPILKDFLCEITGATGEQSFDANQTRTYAVNMKGVANALVTAPEGWSARLSEPVSNVATLSVTAPAANLATRATADSSKDLSILATSSNGYGTIAKMQVVCTNIAPVTPVVTAVLSTITVPTETTLTFDVTISGSSTGWKYICQPAVDTAPDAAKVVADGTAGATSPLTISSLTHNTEYKLYVVASNGSLNSALATATGKTVKSSIIDYYEEGVTIDGVTYSKTTTDVTLVTESGAIAAAGVYFIDPKDNSVAITVAGQGVNGYSNLVLIGRYSNVKPTVKQTNILSMNGTGDGFIFKNILLDGSAFTNYLINTNGTGTSKHLIFEDCRIETAPDKALGYISTAASVGKFVLKNNYLHMNVSAQGKTGVHILGFGSAFVIANTTLFDVSNNVIYANSWVTGGVVNANIGTGINDGLTVNMSNNTFVNYMGVNAWIYANAKAVTMEKNLIWVNAAYTGTAYLVRPHTATNTMLFTATDNCFFGGGAIKDYSTNKPSNITVDAITIPKVATDPFEGGTFTLATGTFIPGTDYADYGSSLK